MFLFLSPKTLMISQLELRKKDPEGILRETQWQWLGILYTALESQQHIQDPGVDIAMHKADHEGLIHVRVSQDPCWLTVPPACVLSNS